MLRLTRYTLGPKKSLLKLCRAFERYRQAKASNEIAAMHPMLTQQPRIESYLQTDQ